MMYVAFNMGAPALTNTSKDSLLHIFPTWIKCTPERAMLLKLKHDEEDIFGIFTEEQLIQEYNDMIDGIHSTKYALGAHFYQRRILITTVESLHPCT